MGRSLNGEGNGVVNLLLLLRAGVCLGVLSLGPMLYGQSTSAAVKPAPAKRRTRRTVRRPVISQTISPSVTSKTTGKTAVRTTTQAGVIHTDKPSQMRVASARRRRGRRVFASPWTEPTYADSTVGDNLDGEDLVVRRAAVDAIGPYNGTVVVADPSSGRILSIVNQKLALKGAYQPCSTVKVMVSLASLSEGIVDYESRI